VSELKIKFGDTDSVARMKQLVHVYFGRLFEYCVVLNFLFTCIRTLSSCLFVCPVLSVSSFCCFTSFYSVFVFAFVFVFCPSGEINNIIMCLKSQIRHHNPVPASSLIQNDLEITS